MKQLIKLVMVISFFLSQIPGIAQTVNDSLWMTDGTVNAIIPSGNTIYIGGGFRWVGPVTGQGVAIDTATGQWDRALPKVNGHISTVVSDSSGGWYIGGTFSSVGGTTRNNLAHIKADKTLDMIWNPNPNDAVMTLAVSGSTLYVAGTFQTIGGQMRHYLAALDMTTGNATGWNPNPDDLVSSIAVSGTAIYVGGRFSAIGGQSRNQVAALDVITGNATSWTITLGGGFSISYFSAMVIFGSTVYVAQYGYSPWRPYPSWHGIQAYDTSAGAATRWSVSTGTYAPKCLAVSESTVYAGGSFTTIAGQSRNHIAAFNSSTGALTNWDPSANKDVNFLHVSGSTVYALGGFDSIGGQPRRGIAALDSSTGAATSWNPKLNGNVAALASFGGTIYAGGDFTSIGTQSRSCIAALDRTTGEATSWNPNVRRNGYRLITTISVYGSTVYVGGAFDSIGGLARKNIAALDSTTGNATDWNPNADDGVNALIPSAEGVYVGGFFKNVGGQPRNYIAKLNLSNGAATGWDPNADGSVYALAISGSLVYAGGPFTAIGGQTRKYLAAINSSTGIATTWDPNISGNFVSSIAISRTNVYVSGYFTNIGGQSRNSIAAIDSTTGNVTSWNPNLSLTNIPAIVLAGSTVYCADNYMKALDAITGVTLNWDPKPNQPVTAIAVSGSTVYIGGNFTTIANSLHSFFAGVSTPPPLPHITSLVIGHGAISPSGVITVPIGGEQSFTITPDLYWRLDSLFVDNLYIDSVTTNYTFKNVTQDHSITAMFKQHSFSSTCNYQDKWNIVSLPVILQSGKKDSLFPTAISPAYYYVDEYIQRDTLQYGEGYWLKFNSEQVVTFTGLPLWLDTIHVNEGWNMIGSLSEPIAVSDIGSDPPGIVMSNAFGYSTSYIITDTLYPGKGYWIKAGQEGSIILSANHLIASANRIRIVPISELPPSVPMENVVIHELPKEFALQQNYPNPFNPSTIINYQLPVDSRVRLIIYNFLGQEVATLVDGIQEGGYKSVSFNVSNLPSGIYVYRLTAGNFSAVKKLVLLK